MTRNFFLILILFFVLAIGYSLAVPLGEGPDEADHYAYAQYIGVNRALPEGPTITQGKHPPLYHGLAAALSAWTGLDFTFLRSNPDAFPLGPDAPPNFFIHTTLESFPWQGGVLAMRLARLLSILLGGVTVWATWQLGRVLFPQERLVGVAAAIFLIGLPGFQVISSVMNNDNAAGAFGALSLLLCAIILRRGFTVTRSLLLGLVFGLGLLSKVGTLALWPMAGLAALGVIWPNRRKSRSWLQAAGHLTLAWGIGLLVALPWLLRNWCLYGDPFGWELVRATVDQRLFPLTPADFVWLAKGLYQYFWGRFGPVGQVYLPTWVYLIAGLASVLLLLGTVSFLWRRRQSDNQWSFVVLFLVAAPLLVIGSIIQYSTIALGTDQARLMWPAIAVIATWFGMGIAGWAGRFHSPQRKRYFAAGFAVVMVSLGFLALLGVVRPAFAPSQPVFPAGSVSAEKLATFGDGFHLLSATLPAENLEIGEPVPVTLLWQAGQPIPDDLRVAVRLVHQDGWLAAEWDHSPGQGRHSTDHWQPGQAFSDPYLLQPSPAAGGIHTVLVRVRPFQEDWLPVVPATDEQFFEVGNVQFD